MGTPAVDGDAARSNLEARIGSQLIRVLEFANQHLGMEVAFVTETSGVDQIYRSVHGDAHSFGIATGNPSVAYCALMLGGAIPNAIPSTGSDNRVSALKATAHARIGAYIGVPIVLADGTVFGSLGCLSHESHVLGERDVRFMELLADLVGPEVLSARERGHARTRIASLIDTTALEVALQPVFDVHDGRCLGVEALARFPVAYGGTETVFESAHSVGLGRDLERLALGSAVALLPDLPPGQFLAVNLTPHVAHELAGLGMNYPQMLPQLVLEITEHAAVDSYAELREALRPMRDNGLRLAIDDAGAGYASLKHVVELEPDIIKVDRSLIDGLAADRARRSVVSAFVLLALDMGAAVIAEGIETIEDLEAVRDLGVDAAQGYLFARPTTDRSAMAGWQHAGERFPPSISVAHSMRLRPHQRSDAPRASITPQGREAASSTARR
jgi:EAL domain-containing protein (putative c-di-GMP-specific phosphodiesterase class I)